MMTVTFFDRQVEGNPINGSKFDTSESLIETLQNLQYREPFFCELVGAVSKLLLGLGSQHSCVQYGALNGDPPYLMAMGANRNDEEGELSFLIGDTATPVPSRYALSSPELWTAIESFMKTETVSPRLDWEEI